MPLVDIDEQKLLGLTTSTDDDLIEALITETQALFEKEVGRGDAPFPTAAITGRTEIIEAAQHSALITLDYPIAAITSIVSGTDVAAPTETILPADTSTVIWQVGLRDIVRVDGGVWRRWGPTWVKVVYNTQAENPSDVKLAIKSKVAEVYLKRDKYGFSSVTRGAKSWTLAQNGGRENPLWEGAVRNHRRAWVR